MQEIIVGTSVLLLMSLFIILFVSYYQHKQHQQSIELKNLEYNFQKKLLETSVAATEAERRRIAQDLHDDVGALLSVTKLSLNTLHTKLQNTDNRLVSQQVRDTLDEAIVQVRRLSRELVPTTLERFGLSAAISEFVQKSGQAGNFNITYATEGNENERFDKKTELMLYRITQELVNNAIKHSGGRKVHIQLALNPHPIELWVEDDGHGFDINEVRLNPKGLGIESIEGRLSIINGKIDYDASFERGCRAKVSLKAA